jgi:hypothetical protein
LRPRHKLALLVLLTATSVLTAEAPYHDARRMGEPQKIPGKIECAYYDLGGEGTAYHDVDSKNRGSGGLNPADGTYLNQFRMEEGVDTSYTKFHDQIDNNPFNLVQPVENQLYVGWTEPGEWFKISVQVSHAGHYTADLLYTSNRGGTISIDVNGKDATGPVARADYFQCRRSRNVATVAPLEPGKRLDKTSSPGRKIGPRHPYPHRRKYESRVFRL